MDILLNHQLPDSHCKGKVRITQGQWAAKSFVVRFSLLCSIAFFAAGCAVMESTTKTIGQFFVGQTSTVTVTPTPTSNSTATPTHSAFIILPPVANPGTQRLLPPTPVPIPLATPKYVMILTPTLTSTLILTPTPTLTPTQFLTETVKTCFLLEFLCSTTTITVTLTPTIPTATFTATPTHTPTSTATPTPPLAPFVKVIGTPVDLRTGPGETYPVVAKLGPNVPLPINGRDTTGEWWRVVANYDEAWIQQSEQITVGNVSTPSLTAYVTPIFYNLAPTALPTFTATPTPPPFERADGPFRSTSTNNRVTVLAKIYVGLPGSEQALPGYILHVEFKADDTLNYTPQPNQSGWVMSQDQFSVGVTGVFYNYKYEFSPVPKGQWQIWLTDSGGQRLAPEETFTTDPKTFEREIYVAWIRLR
ncbi:MAG: SH3 domain-containing protein [Caldilineaceae bacterium]